MCTPKDRGGVGFCDIHAFNLAMLAKQSWRLTQETYSLFYRVYKARYFPTCTFMEAELGSNPYFVWRNLLSARDVLWEGSIWSIGDGGMASIKSHRWLPHSPTVCDGMGQRKVNAWFLPPSRDEVLGTWLGSLDSRDKLVWNENKPQTFSVRMVYQAALCKFRRASAEHSRAWDDKQIGNRLWKLPILPKVRNFVWRVCLNILPTPANLY